MSSPPPAVSSRTWATIANASSLPPRVRKILGVFFTQVSTDLADRTNQMLVEYEQQLFKKAERARSNEKQAEQFANLHAMRKSRADLLPMFLAGLEAEIAAIRLPRQAPDDGEKPRIEYQTLTLVEDADMDQEIVLREIARRHETRAHTQLYLMGQRFGVLAGLPAFDATQLPIGPQSLCRVLRTAAAAAFEIDLESQLLLYKSFDHKVMSDYTKWVEVLNTLLSQNGVLPGLIFAPQRARVEREGARRPLASAQEASAEASRPMTDWYGQSTPSAWSSMIENAINSGQQGQGESSAQVGSADGAASAQEASAGIGEATETEAEDASAAAFAKLQQLLSERRNAATRAAVPGMPGIGNAIAGSNPSPAAPNADTTPGRRGSAYFSGTARTDVSGVPLATQHVLATLQALQAAPVATEPGQPRRTIMNVQQTLLEQVREQHGPQATLVQQDSDTFELLSLLYNEIEREVQRDAPAADLLVRLQVPMAQAALHDREFFLRPQHPARELLNSVAESGATWLGEGETDAQLVQKLHHAVDRVVADYHGDEEVFESVNNDVQAHFRAMARKAEVTERRHVEAARGKDRLEVAKQRAADIIESSLQGRSPQKFVQALLNQAWADVLTLTQLRNGEDSDEWREQVDTTRRIVAATVVEPATDGSTVVDEELTPRIESALVQVGYHPDEASAIARRLSSADGEDEITSRTELTARLKARARLGEQSEIRKKVLVERTAREQECHDFLRTLPFGTWFEFIKNQQGDASRQRLSWYSPITDNALFVNQRGQRIGEQSMDSLARLMALDQVRVVTQGKGRLIDRAWQATISALRNIAGASAVDANGVRI